MEGPRMMGGDVTVTPSRAKARSQGAATGRADKAKHKCAACLTDHLYPAEADIRRQRRWSGYVAETRRTETMKPSAGICISRNSIGQLMPG